MAQFSKLLLGDFALVSLISHSKEVSEDQSHTFEAGGDSFDRIRKRIYLMWSMRCFRPLVFGLGGLILKLLVGLGLLLEMILKQFDVVPVIVNRLDLFLLNVEHATVVYYAQLYYMK